MRRFIPGLFMFALTTLMLLNVNAAERPLSKEAKGAWMTATPAEVETAIQHILETEPAHHLNKDDAARKNLADKIVEVGQAINVPPLLMLSIVFRESSFDEKAVGKLGELGLMQVAKIHVRHLECDMSDAVGQMTCGTKMLRDAFDICHTWNGALTRYATKAGQCTSDSPHVMSKVNLRMRDWQRLSIAVQSHRYEEGTEE
jgi:hypothetical protein